ncbi:uncharacterized protein LOC128983402 [Macrosteles quadrilineatus]|uniref:uncharacterized protein LOC128983402 n=1 Tax=Macrosteles quadrilineatus TaxID=74068 RepID=UPI0023E2276F|nr:uncharacterized protein LOC128983402 [Macrosteles quadrilineatus]XP_054258659.1 uncharacterized protein LOC128983402 [Macrosteles quadrilineatus]
MDYEKRLSHLRSSIDDADRAVDEFDDKFNKIHKYIGTSQLPDTSVVFDSYLPLERSKHKEFIECISTIYEIRNINQNMSTYESTMSSARLKSSLQLEEVEHERNELILQMLEREVARLQSFYSRLECGHGRGV